MARKPREFYEGVPTHITARGVFGRPIFLTDLDRFDFLHVLAKLTQRVGWQVLAWCLMTTHYHLLVVAPRDPANVSWAMQVLNGNYARRFNRWHDRRGHVFGDRFADSLVATDHHLDATIAYILENPVRAGLVKRAEEWPWSGLETLRPRDEVGTFASRNRHIPVRLAG